MIELQNPINNAHMVTELNTLIQHNHKLRRRCMAGMARQDQPTYRQDFALLTELHNRQIHMLSDSVYYLGGAPVKAETIYTPALRRWLDRSSSSEKLLRTIMAEEETLVKNYRRAIKKLVGSDESVSVINKAMDEIFAAKVLLTP